MKVCQKWIMTDAVSLEGLQFEIFQKGDTTLILDELPAGDQYRNDNQKSCDTRTLNCTDSVTCVIENT